MSLSRELQSLYDRLESGTVALDGPFTWIGCDPCKASALARGFDTRARKRCTVVLDLARYHPWVLLTFVSLTHIISAEGVDPVAMMHSFMYVHTAFRSTVMDRSSPCPCDKWIERYVSSLSPSAVIVSKIKLQDLQHFFTQWPQQQIISRWAQQKMEASSTLSSSVVRLFI